jgi:hypothetical protein
MTVNLVNGKAVYEDSTVGSSHDPYGRVTVTRLDKDDNHLFTLTCCGLAGMRLNGSTGFIVAENFDGGEEFDTAVEKYTGFNTDFWLTKIWEYQDRALYARVGPKRYYDIKEMEEADARLLSYAL